MEQPSTRIPQPKSRRTAPLPRPAREGGFRRPGRVMPGGSAGAEPATVCRAPRRLSAMPPVQPLSSSLQRVPGPRLTGLGCGLFTALTMLATGALDRLILGPPGLDTGGASPVAYGLVFLLMCAAAGLWVRPGDLMAAPVSAPIAFTAGLVALCGGRAGGRLISVFTSLALQAGWLYGGTLLAGLIVLLRKAGPAGETAPRA